MGERSRRRVRDLVAQLAFEGRSQNETERARISMMARSDLLHARAGYRSARPTTVLKIQLATHGRSIQLGHERRPLRSTAACQFPLFPFRSYAGATDGSATVLGITHHQHRRY